MAASLFRRPRSKLEPAWGTRRETFDGCADLDDAPEPRLGSGERLGHEHGNRERLARIAQVAAQREYVVGARELTSSSSFIICTTTPSGIRGRSWR
jgi:hypothetical protein